MGLSWDSMNDGAISCYSHDVYSRTGRMPFAVFLGKRSAISSRLQLSRPHG